MVSVQFNIAGKMISEPTFSTAWRRVYKGVQPPPTITFDMKLKRFNTPVKAIYQEDQLSTDSAVRHISVITSPLRK